MAALDTLKGVGEKTLEKLHEEAIFSCEDMVLRFPKRYDERFLQSLSQIYDGRYHYMAVIAETDAKIAYIRSNLKIISFYALIDDKRFLIKVYNQSFLMRTIKQNVPLVIQGKPDPLKKEIVAMKVWMKKHFIQEIFPIYQISSINDKSFSKLVKQCLGNIHITKDFIPKHLIDKYKLMPYASFLEAVHFPQHQSILKQIVRRLKYEELFKYQLKVQLNRYLHTYEKGRSKSYNESLLKTYIQSLPYTLSDSQKKAINEILSDIKKTSRMHRMLQGETGSGKTVVAVIAMIAIMSANYQAAFMAPTELLAEQHYETLKNELKHTTFNIALLTGTTSKSERTMILKQLINGEIQGLVGTHALFSNDVDYQQLGLVITDEQHRFGVRQRAALKAKGDEPDVLYLSATPIPRTLAMTLYGDMDISTLQSRYDMSKKIKTQVLSVTDKTTVRKTMLETLEKHQQIYVVGPVIEDAEESLTKGVISIYETIQKRYPNYKIGLLHGKMASDEKNHILRLFKDHKIHILVATTVIEVGIHVDNANLMVVYHAERFGFAQLHQLRGRIGRGQHTGICLLLRDETAELSTRLKTLETVYDGFTLSEHDLKLRGFGDFVGVMQSGHLAFQYADGKEDLHVMKLAKEDAIAIIESYHKHQQHTELITLVKKQIENHLELDNMI